MGHLLRDKLKTGSMTTSIKNDAVKLSLTDQLHLLICSELIEKQNWAGKRLFFYKLIDENFGIVPFMDVFVFWSVLQRRLAPMQITN